MFTRSLLRVATLSAAVLLSSCAASGPSAPTTRSAHASSDAALVALDSVLAAPADSPTPHVDVPRSRLAEWLAPSAAKKDKRQLHITVYNAPAKVTGGSTAVIGDGNVTADNRKARGPVAVGDSAAAVDNTKAGQKGGVAATAAGSAATDNTKAGQKGGAAALGPNSQATAITEQAGTSWWVFVLVFAGGALAGFVGTVAYLVRSYRP